MKQNGEKIAALTAYDATFAAVLAARGVDMMLVGDSLGMVLQGRRDTMAVTLVRHSPTCRRCCRRRAGRLLCWATCPSAPFSAAPTLPFANAAKLISAGAAMVKIEGGELFAPTVRFVTERGVPVCAHVGLMPQSARADGGFKVQGRDEKNAKRIVNDALAMQDAGAAMIVLELIPAALAGEISAKLEIPTIGIGSGADCDGQILVLHDMLGLCPQKRFTRDFLSAVAGKSGGGGGEAGGWIGDAAAEYVRAVKAGEFPAAENTFS